MDFNKLFQIKKPIIGMIHLAGKNPVERALEELAIFEELGIDGAIIEDYHGTPHDVFNTLKEINDLSEEIINDLDVIIGINMLSNPDSAFRLAEEYNAKFIQFDSVQTKDLNIPIYNQLRNKYPEISVLGGVGFKYISPTGNPLEQDLTEAKPRCDAIVTTGESTGIETPIEKLKIYKRELKNFPLIVGAGVNLDNIYEQLSIVDGAIIGSYFKPNNDTHLPIDKIKVRDLMDVVKSLR